MTDGLDAIQTPPEQPAAPEKVNSFQRIVGVFFSPGDTFASIARKPDVLIPLTVFVIVSLVIGWTLAGHIDYAAVAREAMEQGQRGQNMPAEQMDRMVRIMGGFMKAASYAGPLLSIIGLAIISGVLLLAVRIMGGEGDYKQAFSVTTYAWYPRLLKGILAFIVLFNRKSLSFVDLQNPIRSNLAFLFNPKTQTLAYAFLSSFDIFAIWYLIVLIIGFSEVSKLSRAKTAAIVIVLWLVVVMMTLIGPAIASLRSH